MPAKVRPVDPRLFRHARSSRTGVALLALIGAGQTAATIAVVVALALLVSGDSGRAGALALLAGGFVVRALLAWAEQVIAQRTAARVAGELRLAVLAAALRRGPAWAAGFGTGRLTALLTGGLDALRPWFSGYLPALILAVLSPPVVLAGMALTDPASALIALVTLPLVPLFGALIGMATERRAAESRQAATQLAGHFLDVVRGLATLRLFGRAERQIGVIREMSDRHRDSTVRVLRLAFLSATALDLVATLSVGLIAVEAGLRVAAGDLGLRPALLVILLAPEAYRPLREVGTRFHASADAAAVIAEVDEVLAGAPGTGSDPARDAGAPGAPGVRTEDLRVRHPGAGADALGLPFLEVRPGEFVALRGSSGAGKTTALRVLAGIQPPASGVVRRTGPRPLYLPQTPTLPHARTIADALLLDGETRTDPALIEALAAVRLDAEVAALPRGLDTRLGERGQGLSSGQRQRLALARLLRAARLGPPALLLLDEPTAHLDAGAEAAVIAQLRSAAARGCAVLVVAHRPALLGAADRTVPVGSVPSADMGADHLADVGADHLADATVDHPVGAGVHHPVGMGADHLAGVRAGHPTGVSACSPPDMGVDHPAGVDAGHPAGVDADHPAGMGTGPDPRAGVAAGSTRWASGGGLGSAVLLGAASWISGVTLTGAAGWLLVRASSRPPVLTLSVAVVLVRASAVARPLLRYLERLVSHRVALSRLGVERATVYADLIPRVPGAVRHRRGELLTRVVEDVDTQVDGLLRGRIPAASAALALAAGLAAAAFLLPVAAGALASGLLISAILAPAIAAAREARQDDVTAQARAELSDAVVETVDGLEELASREPVAALVIPDRRSRALATLEARAARTAGLATGLAHLGLGAAVTGLALLAGETGGTLSPEFAAVLLLGAVALAEPVLALPAAAIARRRASGASARLTALTTAAPSVLESSTPGPSANARPGPLASVRSGLTTAAPSVLESSTPDPSASVRLEPTAGFRSGRSANARSGPSAIARPGPSTGCDVTIRGLTAGWDPDRPPVLRGLDLDLPAGSRVAVLGPSGCGKSTLAAVLVRLLDPRAGRIYFGGADLRGIPADVVRARIGLIGDGVDHIFASTLRENLRLARPSASDDELRDVLARVRLERWFAGLPSGLDTWLGQGGTTMSGGEHRRLATARVLLTAPDLLILDEPTEGLDEPTAQALIADLLDAASGGSVLLLTHRGEGLDRVNRIHELVDGVLPAAVASPVASR
jgi:ATP-binding cassette subfamily C protein CydCD